MNADIFKSSYIFCKQERTMYFYLIVISIQGYGLRLFWLDMHPKNLLTFSLSTVELDTQQTKIIQIKN